MPLCDLYSVDMNDRHLSAIDGEVAGAIDDDQEVGEGGADCHFSTPDVNPWKSFDFLKRKTVTPFD